jgi:hypothetical protein
VKWLWNVCVILWWWVGMVFIVLCYWYDAVVDRSLQRPYSAIRYGLWWFPDEVFHSSARLSVSLLWPPCLLSSQLFAKYDLCQFFLVFGTYYILEPSAAHRADWPHLVIFRWIRSAVGNSGLYFFSRVFTSRLPVHCGLCALFVGPHDFVA